MINYDVVKGLEELFYENHLNERDVLSVELSQHRTAFCRNYIHMYKYDFEGCNTSIEPHSKEYKKICTYKVYNNQIYEIFTLKQNKS